MEHYYQTLIKLYYDFEAEDEEDDDIDEYFEDMGYDSEKFRQKLLAMIEQKLKEYEMQSKDLNNQA